jgi:hypothetical protein
MSVVCRPCFECRAVGKRVRIVSKRAADASGAHVSSVNTVVSARFERPGRGRRASAGAGVPGHPGNPAGRWPTPACARVPRAGIVAVRATLQSIHTVGPDPAVAR